jgi:vancomycin resistance protein YoaR
MKTLPESEKQTPKKKGVRPAWRWIFLASAGICLSLLFGATAYAFYYANRILPRTAVAGIAVGGLTHSQAQAILQQREEAFLAQELTASFSDKEWKVQPSALELAFSHADGLDQAYQYGKTGSFLRQLGQMAAAPFDSRSFEIDLYPVNETGRKHLSEAVLAEIEQPMSETGLSLVPGRVTVVPGKDGQRLDYDDLHRALYAAFRAQDPTIALQLKSFSPEVSPAQAEPARVLADSLLSDPWKISMVDKEFTISQSDLAGWLATEVERDGSDEATGLALVLNKEEARKKLGEWAAQADRKAVNAKLKPESGTVSIAEEGRDGLSVDVEATLSVLERSWLGDATATGRTLAAVTKVTRPDLRSDTIAELGIKELLGSATTDYSGSPSNRKFNIGMGQRVLNGTLTKDGETYSTLAHLGPIEESTGYLPELVIKDNRTIPEAGGGLCQVSTTLFRAVLNAGMPIVYRTNHSYRVGYYERGVGPGLDATIYSPGVDFKWKNDSGSAIYIQSYVAGDKITFELYGTKDGRTATISPAQILSETPAGNSIYIPTDDLYKDETKQIETAHSGAKTLVTYTVQRNGQVINTQKFSSNYRAWPAQYLVGTKERPPA